jgi:hypothetical protein
LSRNKKAFRCFGPDALQVRYKVRRMLALPDAAQNAMSPDWVFGSKGA